MNRSLIAAVGWLSALAVLAVAHPGPAAAEVNVSVNIGVPSIVVPAPPVMIPVPRTTVYFAPEVDADLYFSGGFWWTPKEGRWFRSRAYNGPWAYVQPRFVPGEIIRLPRGYRGEYGRGERIPYGQLKKHYEHRDYERKHHEGDWKDEKRARKEDEKREKAERKFMKEERKEHKERGGKHGGRDDRD